MWIYDYSYYIALLLCIAYVCFELLCAYDLFYINYCVFTNLK